MKGYHEPLRLVLEINAPSRLSDEGDTRRTLANLLRGVADLMDRNCETITMRDEWKHTIGTATLTRIEAPAAQFGTVDIPAAVAGAR